MLDLLAMENGGRGIIANDEHFGRVENLTAPGRGKDMGDGWETRRRREPGHDWAILELGHLGTISEIIVDTASMTAEAAAEMIVDRLRDGGYLRADPLFSEGGGV